MTEREEQWKKAIYDGNEVPNLWVSDRGRMRRSPEGQVTLGTPNLDRIHNYLRSMQVCIADPGYCHRHRAVNLHRIVWETFSGQPWVPGYQIDHIDRVVSHGAYENLRMVSRKDNMRNRNLKPPRATDGAASWYRYRQCLALGVRRLKDLPADIQKEYARIQKADLKRRKQSFT